jgi:glutaredoxin 3
MIWGIQSSLCEAKELTNRAAAHILRRTQVSNRRIAAVAQVEIYSSMFCPFCSRAKHLLTQKGIEFIEIDVDNSPGRRNEMLQRANGQHTVPQIFIDDAHIGGSDDLAALDRAGNLDGVLGLG